MPVPGVSAPGTSAGRPRSHFTRLPASAVKKADLVDAERFSGRLK